MITQEDTPRGYRATVFHSLLEPLRMAGAPFKAGRVNVVVMIVIVFGFRMPKWIVVAVLIHLALWWFTKDDVHAIEIHRRAMDYAASYEV